MIHLYGLFGLGSPNIISFLLVRFIFICILFRFLRQLIRDSHCLNYHALIIATSNSILKNILLYVEDSILFFSFFKLFRFIFLNQNTYLFLFLYSKFYNTLQCLYMLLVSLSTSICLCQFFSFFWVFLKNKCSLSIYSYFLIFCFLLPS